jgi:tRNA(fMet)-specific endonuclease VapC
VTYLFDTDTISNLIRPAPSVVLLSRLGATPASEQFTSSITLGELLYGALRASAPVIQEQIERIVAGSMTVIPFDTEAARVYAAVRADLDRRGVPIGDADTRIAAIALVHSLTVVTGNVRHFERVPGLEVENWLR